MHNNDDEIQHPSGSSSWQMPATPAGRTHTHSSVDEERAQAAYQAAQAAFAGSSAARPQPHNAVPQPYHFSAEADLRGRFESHARPLSQADTMPTTTQSYGPPPTTALRGPASVAIPQLRTPTQERIRPRPKRMAQEQPPLELPGSTPLLGDYKPPEYFDITSDNGTPQSAPAPPGQVPPFPYPQPMRPPPNTPLTPPKCPPPEYPPQPPPGGWQGATAPGRIAAGAVPFGVPLGGSPRPFGPPGDPASPSEMYST